MEVYNDPYFMQKALREAETAYEKGEVPIGAVIAVENRIIARTHNLTELLNDVTAHAEMQAITAAAHYIGGKYLHQCTLYVTLEPCAMCAGALYWSQLKRLVYGAADKNRGYSTAGVKLHPKTAVTPGILAEETAALLLQFFREQR